MIKLMKYLKKSAGYIVLIIALLFLQAYCDLSLPDYTSKIINVVSSRKVLKTVCRISFGIQPCRIFRFLWMRIRKRKFNRIIHRKRIPGY